LRDKIRLEKTTHRPDSFLTIFLKLSTTPYTNFASSSNGKPPALPLGRSCTLDSTTSVFEKILSFTPGTPFEAGGRRWTPGRKFGVEGGRRGRVRCQSW